MKLLIEELHLAELTQAEVLAINGGQTDVPPPDAIPGPALSPRDYLWPLPFPGRPLPYPYEK